MHELIVNHSSGSYGVFTGAGLLERAPELLGELAGQPALVVTDENVARHWLPVVQRALPHAGTLILPAGESHKRLETVARIWDALASAGIHRDGVLFALGGGVIGDMTGFAAACWMRGIRYVQLPTTLLAQVDASVGGKTAVDHPAGKNLIGAFHPPVAVIADVSTLATLPRREFACGMAEAIKTALIDGEEMLAWIEREADRFNAGDQDGLSALVDRCSAVKARIVSMDERESGIRAVLNLGHTFGHAIEKLSGYQVLHGEAVAAGLVIAARLSEELLDADSSLRSRLVTLLQRLGLPVGLPAGIEPEAMLDAMRLDKKHRADGWRLILLEAAGRPVIRQIGSAETISAVLQESRAV